MEVSGTFFWAFVILAVVGAFGILYTILKPILFPD